MALRRLVALKPTRIMIEGRRFYPTEITLPVWARSRIMTSLARFKIQDIRVNLLRDKPDLTELLRPSFAPELPATLNPREYLTIAKETAPIDGVEIVEWMQGSYADNAILSSRLDEYNRLGSQLVGRSSDPWYPGVVVEDCSFRSERGRDISARGYAIGQTPRGNFRVDVGSKAVGAARDLLTWGAVPWSGYTQWIGTFLKWKSLANTPITGAIGFPTTINPVTRGFLSAPQFVVLSPSRPALRVSVSEVFSCGADERLEIIYRDPNDYTRVLARDWIDLPAGQSEVNYSIISFPYVPPVVHEMQPEDNKTTALNRFTTSP